MDLRKFRRCFAALPVFFCLLLPLPAAAVQQHGGAEGLVAHQIGHLLFLAGMLLLLYRLRATQMNGRGWPLFRLFIWLIIWWNVLTFYGHLHRELIDPGQYVAVDGRVTGFAVETPLDFLFYLSRLDHLLLVPAFVVFLLTIREWRKRG